MALPAIAAGAARGLAGGSRGLAKVGKGMARGARRGIGRAAARPPEAEEPEEETAAEAATRKIRAIFSPEGIVMMFVGGILDLLSLIGAILILAFGTGLLFAKIVYIVGLVIVGAWAFFRSGTVGVTKKGKREVRTILNFLKRQWPKLGGKFIPAIGDALPLWSYTIYSELTS